MVGILIITKCDTMAAIVYRLRMTAPTWAFQRHATHARAGGPRPKVKIGGSWGWGPRQGSTVTCSSVDVPYITLRAASKALRL